MTMLSGISRKTLRDQRFGLLGWAAGLILLIAMYVAMWPSIRDQPSMRTLLDQMPEALRGLFSAGGADLSTPTGYVQVELLAFMGPMLLLIYAITTGAAAIAGEEEHRTADLLLTCGVRRSDVVLHKAAALAAGVTALALVTGAALVAEGALVGMHLPAGRVAAAMLHLALLALVFGSLALAIGATFGHAGASRAIPAAVAVLAYVVNGLGQVIGWLRPVRKLSPFYQYLGHDPLRTGVSVAALLVAGVTVAALLGVAMLGVRRRDFSAQ
ncbi:MAG TPA: ABC transporter permease subunit [Jatrophihabitans sp.]|nr:ABC transporter permease subunit [Jatrophihabitans sp.]